MDESIEKQNEEYGDGYSGHGSMKRWTGKKTNREK